MARQAGENAGLDFDDLRTKLLNRQDMSGCYERRSFHGRQKIEKVCVEGLTV